MMGVQGTFAYDAVVPDEPRTVNRRFEMKRSQPDDRRVGTLLGAAPIFESVEYQREPWQLYTRVTLTPSDGKGRAGELSFSLDRELIAMLRPGDVVHVVRNIESAIGFSVLRNDRLVAAVGAITSVPLGHGISARVASDVAREMEVVAQRHDSTFKLREIPLLVEVDHHRRILTDGGRVGVYEIFSVSRYLAGRPNLSECAAMFQPGVSPDTAAQTSAQLMVSTEDGVKLSKSSSSTG